jgi:hypothetical protein
MERKGPSARLFQQDDETCQRDPKTRKQTMESRSTTVAAKGWHSRDQPERIEPASRYRGRNEVKCSPTATGT